MLRLYYSFAVLGVQFLLPSGLLVLAHARIYTKLASLPFWGKRSDRQAREEMNQQGRTKGSKTIYLLVSVVVIFMSAWLPLNLLNILLDLGLLDQMLRLGKNLRYYHFGSSSNI